MLWKSTWTVPTARAWRRMGLWCHEPSALPARAAHGTITPFDARHGRLEQSTSISRALVNSNYFDRRHLLEIIESKIILPARAFAADRDLPGLGIHFWNV